MLLISTHARPIQPTCNRIVITVLHYNGAVKENIQTSLLLYKYTMDMQGMHMADQLRASYCCQVQSCHKWWHHIFFFLLDMMIVNMYIIYLAHVKNSWQGRIPMTHLQFKVGLCRLFWIVGKGGTSFPKMMVLHWIIICPPLHYLQTLRGLHSLFSSQLLSSLR